MTGVAVSRSVLLWMIQRSSNPAELESRFPKLGEWLSGQGQPTIRQLDRLARATGTPLGYFFLPEPPEERLPIPHFRTLGDRKDRHASANLLETVQTMERRQAWLREYLIEEGHDPLPFVGSASVADDATKVAGAIRATLGMDLAWAANQPNWSAALRELERRMEAAGILVVVNGVVGNNTHRKLDVGEFRGFVLTDEYCPLVFVNGADGKAAQMFTLAHELAHIWFGESAVFDLVDLHPAGDAVEQACNRVAAEFLVPEDELRQWWPQLRQGSGRFDQLAKRFKVSELVAARRALDLQLISQGDFREFYRAYLEDERSRAAQDREGGNFYATQNLRISRRFAEAVVRAASEGRLLYRDAYQLTGLYGTTFAEYAQRLDGGGVV